MEISRELKYKYRLDSIFIFQALIRSCLGQKLDFPIEEGYIPRSVYFPLQDKRGETMVLMRWWGFRPTTFYLKKGDIILAEE